MRSVCGLDVHKDSVFLCILCETGEIFENVYGVLTYQLHGMCRDMKRHGVTEVSMESTHFGVLLFLEAPPGIEFTI